MALHVSTSPGEQLYFRDYLVHRFMDIKYGTREMAQSGALMEKFRWKKLDFFFTDHLQPAWCK